MSTPIPGNAFDTSTSTSTTTHTARPAAQDIVQAIHTALVDIGLATKASKTAHKEWLAHVMTAGKLLCQAKESNTHGNWADWLKTNFKLHERTAQRYMERYKSGGKAPPKVAKVKTDTVSDLPAASPIVERVMAAKDSAPAAASPPSPPPADDILTTTNTLINTLRTIAKADALRAKAEAAKIVDRFRGLGLI